ncbi:cell division control protein [Atractiella rhizophila]|nr:cell division control protein [Atractiella rhizophila]
MNDYVKIEKVGEGTYGVVYKARHTPSNTIRALKRIRFDDTEDGIPATAIREISVLKEMTGFKLYEVFLSDSRLYLSFEFMDVDLHRYIHHKFLWQILTGLEFLHMRRIIHRDLKPQNLLIDMDGNLKIADFGLARSFGVPMHSYTHEVVTLWYRAPEILLGTKHYGTAVDIWSVGAIWAEMITGQAIFQGDSEIDQIFKIFRVWGTPTPEQWPALSIMPDYKPSFPKFKGLEIEDLMPEMDDIAVDLFYWMMHFDSLRRATAKKALRHRILQFLDRDGNRRGQRLWWLRFRRCEDEQQQQREDEGISKSDV